VTIRQIRLHMTDKKIGTTNMKSYPHWDGKTFYKMPTYRFTISGTTDSGKNNSKSLEVIRFGLQKKTPTSDVRVVGLADKQTHVIKIWLPNYRVHSAASKEIGAWKVYDNFLIHDGPDNPKYDVYGSIGCIEVGGKGGFDEMNDYIIRLSGAEGKDRKTKLLAIGRSGKLVILYDKAIRPPLKPWTR